MQQIDSLRNIQHCTIKTTQMFQHHLHTFPQSKDQTFKMFSGTIIKTFIIPVQLQRKQQLCCFCAETHQGSFESRSAEGTLETASVLGGRSQTLQVWSSPAHSNRLFQDSLRLHSHLGWVHLTVHKFTLLHCSERLWAMWAHQADQNLMA